MTRFLKIVLVGSICVVFIALRLWNLPQSITVGTDQGLHLLAIYDIVHNHHLTLIGPPSSFALPGGRMFFFGPLIFYAGIPPILVFGWNVLTLAYYLIGIQFGAFIIAWFSVAKRFGFKAGVFFALLFTLSPTMVQFSRFLWNANLLIPVCCLLLAWHAFLPTRKAALNLLLVCAIGVMWGLGLQSHYSFVIVSAVSFIVLLRQKLVNAKSLLALGVGFGVGFAPMIVFELKHKFYNSETMILYLYYQLTGKGEAPRSWAIQYFLFIFPFLFFFGGLILKRLYTWKAGLVAIFLIGYMYWSCNSLIPKPAHGYLSHEGLSYVVLADMRDKILRENKPDYNVIDFMTGDARASYLRALLTYAGKPPMAVNEYPIAKTTYIFGTLPLKKILTSDLWEAQAVANSKFVKQWEYPGGVHLYMISREEVKQ